MNEHEDPLAAARGVANGVFITTIFWIGVGLGYVLGRYIP